MRAGLRPGQVARGGGGHGGRRGFCFQPPAVIEQPSRESRSPEWEGDDLCHGRNDARPFGSGFAQAAQDLRSFVQISRKAREFAPP